MCVAKYRKDEPRSRVGRPVATALLGYLKAKRVDERLQYAMEYAKQPASSISSDWLKDVGRQLVREGAIQIAANRSWNHRIVHQTTPAK